jgi:hypothetical protein
MYILKRGTRRDKFRQWALPDRVFFAAGACHILAHAFLERYSDPSFQAVWIRPKFAFAGNHIFVSNGDLSFDYHGYTVETRLIEHFCRRARRFMPGWDADIIAVSVSLVSFEQARTIGLFIREPGQFLHNPIPRAHKFLGRFPAPPLRLGGGGFNAAAAGRFGVT